MTCDKLLTNNDIQELSRLRLNALDCSVQVKKYQVNVCVKALSHGHLDAHRIHLVRWFGCAFKQDRIIIHNSREVTPTMRSLGQLALLVCLAYGACLSLLSVLLLQQHWGKRGLFADGQVEWYSTVKLKARWFHCLQYLNSMYYKEACLLMAK